MEQVAERLKDPRYARFCLTVLDRDQEPVTAVDLSANDLIDVLVAQTAATPGLRFEVWRTR